MIVLTQEPFDTNYEKGIDKVKYRDAIAYKNQKRTRKHVKKVWRHGDVSVLEMILNCAEMCESVSETAGPFIIHYNMFIVVLNEMK